MLATSSFENLAFRIELEMFNSLSSAAVLIHDASGADHSGARRRLMGRPVFARGGDESRVLARDQQPVGDERGQADGR